jgi:Cytochrome oxidase complex assembly protein 1
VEKRVPTAPYPLQPEPLTRGWIERHPLWKIPLGCLTLALLMAALGAVTIMVISTSFRASDVYKQAISQAAGNARVREQIGEPIEVGWFIFGELKYSGAGGYASFTIPIAGPRGKGRIQVVANKNEVWRFTCLRVFVDGQPQAIDLLSVQPPPERDF